MPIALRRERGHCGPMGTKTDIAAELYAALKKLGAGGQLLSIVGSFGDSLDDDDVLALLRHWNRRAGNAADQG